MLYLARKKGYKRDFLFFLSETTAIFVVIALYT